MNFLKIIVLLLASASVTLAGNIVRKDGIWNVFGQNYNLRISENGIPIGLESGGKSFDFSQFIPVKFETDKGDVEVSNSSFKGSRCENGRLFFDYENQYVDYSIVVIPAEKYLDFTDTPYQFCYIYFLEKQHLSDCLQTIKYYFDQHTPQLVLYQIYINNILLLFFANYSRDYTEMDAFLSTLSFPTQKTSIKYERVAYPNFKSLLTVLIQKLKRYDMLYFADGDRLIPNFNYEHITAQTIELTPRLISPDQKVQSDAKEELKHILSTISSREFFLQLSTQVLVAISTHISSWTVAQLTDFFSSLQLKADSEEIYTAVMHKIDEILASVNSQSASYSSFIEELLHYLDEHISDSNLTLKWIAENHLYMNVNYVSRCFVKETHQKFSSYLMNLRVQKAKEILKSNDEEKIQHVAELVGCGNNPYYFSKIFKKCTGMTPSAYIRKSKSETTK